MYVQAMVCELILELPTPLQPAERNGWAPSHLWMSLSKCEMDLADECMTYPGAGLRGLASSGPRRSRKVHMR
jgi:hypothetical protein